MEKKVDALSSRPRAESQAGPGWRVHRAEHQRRESYRRRELQRPVKGSPLRIQLSTDYHVHEKELSEAGERITEKN